MMNSPGHLMEGSCISDFSSESYHPRCKAKENPCNQIATANVQMEIEQVVDTVNKLESMTIAETSFVLDDQISIPEITSTREEKEVKLDSFKNFDVLEYSNGKKHHYSKEHDSSLKLKDKIAKVLNKMHIINRSSDDSSSSKLYKPSKQWIKNIQEEWKIMMNGLPDSIFVRVYENRMDILKAVIIGPKGTPYEHGLFFFDVFFPLEYPEVPPKVYYNSHGLRLNPNLYSSGKVCLSLLGTWTGRGCERWKPGKSTILQVLVSIQGLVLNEYPYYNEPVLVNASTEQSLLYNLKVTALSCKTMIYTMANPPKEFKDFVYYHFFMRNLEIFRFCEEWKEKTVRQLNDASQIVSKMKDIEKITSSLTRSINAFRNNTDFSTELEKLKDSTAKLSHE